MTLITTNLVHRAPATEPVMPSPVATPAILKVDDPTPGTLGRHLRRSTHGDAGAMRAKAEDWQTEEKERHGKEQQ